MLAQRLGCSRLAPVEGTNIYIPYYFLQQKSPRDVALFTHYDNVPIWERAAQLADVCVAMSAKTAQHLPADKTVVIPIPPDPQFARKIRFGVSGRDYAAHGTDRKRLKWLDSLRLPGTEIVFTGGFLAWADMPAWYRSIDYLLVLSDNEGGPMGVVEALASGTPVIAPDVGWAWDYPVIRYRGLDDLRTIMRKLTTRPDAWDMTADRFLSLC
jgi:hypothetical protein